MRTVEQYIRQILKPFGFRLQSTVKHEKIAKEKVGLFITTVRFQSVYV